MDTFTFNGHRLQQTIKARFGSVNRLISYSSGKLTRNNRSAIYRAIEGRAIKRQLAEAIVGVLDTELAALSPTHQAPLRLTPENYLFNTALRLLRRRPIENGLANPATPSPDVCLADWLRERMDVSESTFCCILDELARVGHIQQMATGVWVRVTPTLPQITRSLKRRIESQWPIIRDVFAQDLASRRQTGFSLLELIQVAETKLLEPLAFFGIDDQIHECLCTHSTEVELVRVSRAASWGIAYDLILDLSSEMVFNPAGAAQSMKAIGGWMIDDYKAWAHLLIHPREKDSDFVGRSFRRHVLRMRDHAQYYAASKSTQGEGKLCPGSV
ncbi:hypothetical protein N9N28_15455 [Rubripirellula amarantea]|nr:hypothetical protein [Rubripirellula amarantea]